MITLKGVRAIESADIVLYDALVSPEILKLIPNTTPSLCVGKRAGMHSYKQEEINELIVEFAYLYGHVVRLKGGEWFAATLCSARIAAGETVILTREAGRRGLPSLPLPAGRPLVWDGRYELETSEEGLTAKGLAGLAAKLPVEQKAKLRRIDARARGALPLIQSGDGTVSCPVLAGDNGVRARSLVRGRFLSTYGTILSERQACDVLCMAN